MKVVSVERKVTLKISDRDLTILKWLTREGVATSLLNCKGGIDPSIQPPLTADEVQYLIDQLSHLPIN